MMASKFTCDDEGIFPELTVEEIPIDAKFLVLIVDDPDAPAGTWNHLLLANIPIEWIIQTISQKDFETAVFGQNSRGELARWGPCPPSGTHRYIFKGYAITERLPITPGFSKERLYETITGKILDQAELIWLYKRK